MNAAPTRRSRLLNLGSCLHGLFRCQVSKYSAAAYSRRPRDSSLLKSQAFVGNRWISADNGGSFPINDPSTGDHITSVPDFDVGDVRKAIGVAQEAFDKWKMYTSKNRHQILKNWHSLIMAKEHDLATLVTAENGKPFKEALGEVRYGASFIEWFAEESRRVYGDIIPNPLPGQRILVFKQPIGVVAIITPWNFPIAMVTRKVGAALAAGCTTVIKPASETPLSALALAELGMRAGIPPGVINVVTTSHKHTKSVGEELTTHPGIRKVSFTGSTNVGKMIMRQSSSTLKKISLELGGNAPFIVFEDADVSAAVEGALASKFRGSGQTCVCANRIFVHRSIQDEFAAMLSEKVEQTLRVGDGFNPDVALGPLINAKAVAKVRKHLDNAVSQGATVVTKPQQLSLGPNYVQPHVVKDCQHHALLAADEETFGPLAFLYPFDTTEDVIRMANSTEMGLAGYFYSKDLSRVWRVADALEVGMVGINTGMISTEVAPFGGVKQSGIGREGSKYGIEDYLDLKYICMAGI